MQIDSISYSRSKNVGYREYEDIEVSAAVTTDDDPQSTLLYLQKWVNEKLQIREEVAKLDSRKEQLQGEIYDLERSVKHAKDKWQNVQEFFKKLGIEVPSDIPF